MRPPGWQPRLIALDIDGTTVHERRPPSPRVLAAVREIGRHAVVTLCTGRTVVGVGHVLDQLGLGGRTDDRYTDVEHTTVCSNGAVVLDTGTRQVRYAIRFEPGPVVEAVREALPGAVFGCEEVGVGQRIGAPFPDGILAGRVRLVDEAELLGEPTPKVVAYWPHGTPDDVAERMAGVEVPGAEVTLDHELPWVSMVPEGVSKASALAEVARVLGVPRTDVLAVGDGDNDRAMLRWAGLGVAMGQAPPEVKADADEVTGSVEEDGLAAVLERYL
ncbi:Cof-type HAD-IIB family hydrolase [Pseudonocardia yuanmonensis]|uniref:Cof-type HAD-IIB family hydrolase n=1 Tax=Pseudonocardia yuanmonensis TaxID=1095914 RepID=A0ABP8WLP7_9PSEU